MLISHIAEWFQASKASISSACTFHLMMYCHVCKGSPVLPVFSFCAYLCSRQTWLLYLNLSSSWFVKWQVMEELASSYQIFDCWLCNFWTVLLPLLASNLNPVLQSFLQWQYNFVKIIMTLPSLSASELCVNDVTSMLGLVVLSHKQHKSLVVDSFHPHVGLHQEKVGCDLRNYFANSSEMSWMHNFCCLGWHCEVFVQNEV